MDIQLFSRSSRQENNVQTVAPLKNSSVKFSTEQRVAVQGEEDMLSFKSYLHDWLVSTLQSLSIETPTMIQQKCIPKILEGKDIFASAKTGSGKTAAFALPILQKLSLNPFGTFAVILTPTRELAFQIGEQIKAFGQNVRVSVEVVVGGVDMMKQARQLNGRPHFVVGTPGRLADLIESCSDCLHLRKLRYLILDEADRLLESSFHEHLQTIFRFIESSTNGQRPQVMMFSATLTRELSSMLRQESTERNAGPLGDVVVEAALPVAPSGVHKRKKLTPTVKFPEFLKLKDPYIFHCDEDYETVLKLVQKYLLVPSQVREVYLVYVLRTCFADIKSLIIFTGKCKTAELLRLIFRELGIRCSALHSKMSQSDRLGSIAKFKSNVVPILITTDVGSRGLDIPSVQLVINYDVPADPRDYVHRIGRTARAGRGGLALTFIGEMDLDLILAIESSINVKLANFLLVEDASGSEDESGQVCPAPLKDRFSERNVLSMLTEVSTAKRVASLQLMENHFDERHRLNKKKSLAARQEHS